MDEEPKSVVALANAVLSLLEIVYRENLLQHADPLADTRALTDELLDSWLSVDATSFHDPQRGAIIKQETLHHLEQFSTMLRKGVAQQAGHSGTSLLRRDTGPAFPGRR